MKRWHSGPFEMKAEKGESILFCACDFSKNGPFCDGSHRKINTYKTPIRCTFEKDCTIKICGCQNSKNRPFCDNSHIKLPGHSLPLDHLPTKKHMTALLCQECTPKILNFISDQEGFCENCGKFGLVMIIKDYYDKFDWLFYRDVGGESG